MVWDGLCQNDEVNLIFIGHCVYVWEGKIPSTENEIVPFPLKVWRWTAKLLSSWRWRFYCWILTSWESQGVWKNLGRTIMWSKTCAYSLREEPSIETKDKTFFYYSIVHNRRVSDVKDLTFAIGEAFPFFSQEFHLITWQRWKFQLFVYS